MAYAEVEPGVRLFYRDLGAGRPVMLLHGWTMTHQVWDRTVQGLAARYRLILPDLRGHGESDKPVADYGPHRHAADVNALMARLDLRDVTLIGWSFGGTTALCAAQDEPDRLAQLVLINAAAPKYLATADFPDGHSEATLQEWLVRERDDLAAWRRFCMEAMPRAPYDELFVQWLWMQSMQSPSWAAGPMLEAYARADLRPGLDAMRTPTLILHGAHDVFCAPAAARYLAARIPDAELIEFFDCGHSPQWEDPERCAAALDAFLVRARVTQYAIPGLP